uniref:Uncharacterized protein n=1 Tax=Kwoniella bestiolae CBS 10118 TaxID=1296100 RepID=A0A1B9G7D1_9TREE|nr:hypothetical protein I302_04630 [Kwoniella bestiolae CBS 10118]OCF26939.1 hypothetical protein I302_04630 [Kwoniella bestiolae CBS 10118]
MDNPKIGTDISVVLKDFKTRHHKLAIDEYMSFGEACRSALGLTEKEVIFTVIEDPQKFIQTSPFLALSGAPPADPQSFQRTLDRFKGYTTGDMKDPSLWEKATVSDGSLWSVNVPEKKKSEVNPEGNNSEVDTDGNNSEVNPEEIKSEVN